MATTTADRIRAQCAQLAEFLIEKNRCYGDSALNPIGIFARGEAEELIRVRIDDKLSRMARGQAAGEDVIKDLAGYLILLMVAREGNNNEETER